MAEHESDDSETELQALAELKEHGALADRKTQFL